MVVQSIALSTNYRKLIHELSNIIQIIQANIELDNNAKVKINVQSLNNLVIRTKGVSFPIFLGVMENNKKEEFDYVSVVNDILDTNSIKFQKKGCLLKKEIPEKMRIKGDIDLLRMVTQNLVINAIKYSVKSKPIIIKLLDIDDQYIEFAIINSFNI